MKFISFNFKIRIEVRLYPVMITFMNKEKIMSEKTKRKNVPVRPEVLEKLKARKREKGISIQRTAEDALGFALDPKNKKNWW